MRGETEKKMTDNQNINNVENQEITEQELNEILRVRREKLADMCAAGKNPFEKVKYDFNAYSEDIKAEFKDDEDQEFARRLFRRTILNSDYYRHLVSENTKNWELDRIAFMDVIIMQTALAEILSFPNIPVSVSLNEYVEIAKLYSTSKSGSFINGTLDGIVNQLKKEGKLTKN